MNVLIIVVGQAIRLIRLGREYYSFLIAEVADIIRYGTYLRVARRGNEKDFVSISRRVEIWTRK